MAIFPIHPMIQVLLVPVVILMTGVFVQRKWFSA